MTLFIDTSALYAILDANDTNHEAASLEWLRRLDENTRLLCHNYILVETVALLQSRIGIEAVRTLHQDILPVMETFWITEEIHEAGMGALLSASRRKLSLVDCLSFEVMRRYRIQHVFAFDPHFSEQDFLLIPSASAE